MSRHPEVRWAEREDKVYLTVMLADAKDVKVNLHPGSIFTFSGSTGDDDKCYELKLELFAKVDMKESKVNIGSKKIFCILIKAEKKWWNKLLRGDGKSPHYVKVDWDKWIDEDDDKAPADIDTGGMDFSNIGAMGGGSGDTGNSYGSTAGTGQFPCVSNSYTDGTRKLVNMDVPVGRHPEVRWAEHEDKVYLIVVCADAKDAKVNLDPEGVFTFSGLYGAGGHNNWYELKLELLDKVEVEESKVNIGTEKIFCILMKAEKKWWNKLLRGDGKSPNYVQVDWEATSDIDTGAMDFSKFGDLGGRSGVLGEGTINMAGMIFDFGGFWDKGGNLMARCKYRKSERKSEQQPTTISALPRELAVEILSRLPRKQVGICKCVCLLWKSMICSHPFRQAYRRKNPGLLLKYRSWAEEEPPRLRFFQCPLRRQHEPPEDFSPLTELDLSGKRSVTELVDGLLCSYESWDGSSISGLTLHNISTGEKMGIPDPLPSGERVFLYLGYDGVTKAYKLLGLIFNRSDCAPTLQGAYVMTLMPPSGPAASTWRELPLGDCGGSPRDYDDVLRTARACSDSGLLCWIRQCTAIVWFDLSKERFRLAQLPQDVTSGRMEFRALTRVKDRLAVWVSYLHSTPISNVNVLSNVVSCFVQEDDEGRSWRISKEFRLSGGFAFAAGIFPSSSLRGEMLGMNLDDQRRVVSYSRREEEEDEDVFFAGNLPEPGEHVFHECCQYYGGSSFSWSKHYNSWLSCLAEPNSLYMPLNDILGGCFE